MIWQESGVFCWKNIETILDTVPVGLQEEFFGGWQPVRFQLPLCRTFHSSPTHQVADVLHSLMLISVAATNPAAIFCFGWREEISVLGESEWGIVWKWLWCSDAVFWTQQACFENRLCSKCQKLLQFWKTDLQKTVRVLSEWLDQYNQEQKHVPRTVSFAHM